MVEGIASRDETAPSSLASKADMRPWVTRIGRFRIRFKGFGSTSPAEVEGQSSWQRRVANGLEQRLVRIKLLEQESRPRTRAAAINPQLPLSALRDVLQAAATTDVLQVRMAALPSATSQRLR